MKWDLVFLFCITRKAIIFAQRSSVCFTYKWSISVFSLNFADTTSFLWLLSFFKIFSARNFFHLQCCNICLLFCFIWRFITAAHLIIISVSFCYNNFHIQYRIHYPATSGPIQFRLSEFSSYRVPAENEISHL